MTTERHGRNGHRARRFTHSQTQFGHRPAILEYQQPSIIREITSQAVSDCGQLQRVRLEGFGAMLASLASSDRRAFLSSRALR